MPRGKPKKLNPEIYAANAALEEAKAVTADAEKALEAAATEGVNKFIQTQAAELLARVEADVAARGTDEPSGVTVGTDYSFLRDDPTAPGPRLARKGVEERKDHRYHWINRDPRRIERRINQGWLPVAGGSISNGDSVLASMPEDRAKKLDAQIAERNRIRQGSAFTELEQVSRQTGVEVFDGNKSLRDGLD